MNNKLLIICGPTSTGKTNLSLFLAKKFNGEVLSADSRQIFKNMDIGTGKDIPADSIYKRVGSKLRGYYLIRGIRVWGYDLADPNEEFSVFHYLTYASLIIKDIWKRNKLPILTGGTGLYIKLVVDGIDSGGVPRNTKLRTYLQEKNPDELYEMLAQLDPLKAASLNISDRKNSRRLIRAIEITDANIKGTIKRVETVKPDSLLFIGLTSSLDSLTEKIKARVKKRIRKGFNREVLGLLKKGVDWKNQSMTSLGYRQWKDYIKGRKDKKQVIEEWIREERKYVKRQMTWFNKDERINWYDINKNDWKKRLELKVGKWYKLRKRQIK